MKANSCGTMDEQIRARAGFVTLKERKARGDDLTNNCRSCRFFDTKAFTNRDGGVGISTRCGRPSGGFTTRDSACCIRWEIKLS